MSTVISSKRNNVGALTERNSKGNDVLDHAASYLLASPGKLIRPALVLLLSYCCVSSPQTKQKIQRALRKDIVKLRRIVANQNPQDSAGKPMAGRNPPMEEYTFPALPSRFENILLLACITEFIHVASLLHDDVIDNAATRRGKPSLYALRGTKVSVLAGDFLFSRACGLSTLLNSIPVVSLMSSALEELVRGELLQMGEIIDTSSYYEKNYRKTGSLLEKSLTSAMILMNRSSRHPRVRKAAGFGSHLGQAFQIIDDCLDFSGSEDVIGKPRLADLREGTFTLPVILAVEKDPSTKATLSQKMSDADIDEVIRRVTALNTVQEAKTCADGELGAAMRCLDSFPQCKARRILEGVAQYIITRNS